MIACRTHVVRVLMVVNKLYINKQLVLAKKRKMDKIERCILSYSFLLNYIGKYCKFNRDCIDDVGGCLSVLH